MNGLMMEYPLTLRYILERSAKIYPYQEIASRLPDGSIHRYTYSGFYRRVHRIAHLFERLELGRGERVGTLCWNDFRHLELYFAAPCAGLVLHTLNPRLSVSQLEYIANHAEDRAIFVDASLLPLFEQIRPHLHSVRHVIVLNDLPGTLPPGVCDFERELELVSNEPFDWPRLDENVAAAMCYTSGTTGDPKGVLYTHRGLFLLSYGLCMADTFALSERDSILQLVPMYHANGWGIPVAGIMTGARIVFPGSRLHSEDIALLLDQEQITFSAAVPTIWMMLYDYLQSHPIDLSHVRELVSGGSALPREFVDLYHRKYGIQFRMAWGMTESSPIGTINTLKRHMDSLPDDKLVDALTRHGLPIPGIDLRLVDEVGNEVPWDGRTQGEIQTRGPWVTSGYYKDPECRQFSFDQWFQTGDLATIDPEGSIQIIDRKGDMIKSGGEWISSVDLENAIMAHPKVAEAAVIAVFHPRWVERPLACVAPLPQYRDEITATEILAFLAGRVPKWWLPDAILFIEAVPKTSVGKFDKRALREQHKDFRLPA